MKDYVLEDYKRAILVLHNKFTHREEVLEDKKASPVYGPRVEERRLNV